MVDLLIWVCSVSPPFCHATSAARCWLEKLHCALWGKLKLVFLPLKFVRVELGVEWKQTEDERKQFVIKLFFQLRLDANRQSRKFCLINLQRDERLWLRFISIAPCLLSRDRKIPSSANWKMFDWNARHSHFDARDVGGKEEEKNIYANCKICFFTIISFK